MTKEVWFSLAAVAGILAFGYISTSRRVQVFEGDTPYYLAIAEQLALDPPHFRNPRSPWPNTPAMDRGPGWPFTLSLMIRLFRNSDRIVLVKSAGAIISIANVILVAILTFEITRSNICALCSGLAWAVNPHTLALIEDGATEPIFVLLAALGLAAMQAGRGSIYWGAFLFGLSCLVRQFFVIFPLALVIAYILFRFHRGPSAYPWRRILICGFVFLIPVTLWCYRNYTICGRVPVLSTLGGETFYGSNNPVVANQLQTWGYWIMPDEIPGEVNKRKLSQTLTESDTDRYYFYKGLRHVQSHWFELPRHLLGKLIRGYVPIPWVASWSSYIVFLYRLILYISFSITLKPALRICPHPYPLVISAMLITSVSTTVIFYGAARFTYCFEPFLIPLIALGIHSRCMAGPARASALSGN